MNPHRLQRTRSNRNTPPGAAYVGRGSFWANPFLANRFGHARAYGLHRAWFAGRLTVRALRLLDFNDREIAALNRLHTRQRDRLPELTGQTLTCWCARRSRFCHADTLAEAAAQARQPLERLAA